MVIIKYFINFVKEKDMKRISDFVDCRMDMKKMAAINGGVTNGSNVTRSYEGCGDFAICSWKDDFLYNGTLYMYDFTCEEVQIQCD